MFHRLKPHIAPILILIAATCAVYAQSLSHDFLINWDDKSYVINNSAARGFSFAHLKAAFTNYYVGNYAPLHIISYMLDYSLWGLKAAGFIFTNILLHILNGTLFYLLLVKMTGRRVWAFLAGFIFLLHPVQVESVAWISQRKNVLAMFFFLVSFLLYVGYKDRGTGLRPLKGFVPQAGIGDFEKGTRISKFQYAGSIAAFTLSLLAKSVTVILPLVLLVFDLCFVPTEKRRRWIADKVPYIAAAAAVGFIALKSQAPELGGGRTGYHGGTPLATFLTMLPVFARYLGMFFWPVELSAAYNPPIKTGVDATVVLSALLLAFICIGSIYLRSRRKDLFFWGILFSIGFLPVSQIVPLVTLMNDRYYYFPMLGGAAFIAGVAASGMDAFAGARRKMLVAVLSLALLTLPFLSFKRAQVWQNSLTLWTDAYAKVPDSPVVCCALGEIYNLIGRRDAALSLYLRALSLSPADREALQSVSILYLSTGKVYEAWPYVQRLVKTYPQFDAGYAILGYYYLLTGDYGKADEACRQALALKPRSGFVWRYLGRVYQGLNNIESATESYRQALAVGGGTPEVRYNLSYLAALSGRRDESLIQLEAALQQGYRNLAVIVKHPLWTLPEFQQLLARYGGVNP